MIKQLHAHFIFTIIAIFTCTHYGEYFLYFKVRCLHKSKSMSSITDLLTACIFISLILALKLQVLHISLVLITLVAKRSALHSSAGKGIKIYR